MPNDWWNLLGIVASFTTIISFVAYVVERIKRQRQSDFVIGFLTALSAQAKAMGQAGEEWRYDVAKQKATPQQAKQYANVAVNSWLKIEEGIEKALQELKTI
jgi:hypothetical protein